MGRKTAEYSPLFMIFLPALAKNIQYWALENDSTSPTFQGHAKRVERDSLDARYQWLCPDFEPGTGKPDQPPHTGASADVPIRRSTKPALDGRYCTSYKGQEAWGF